MVSTWEYVPSLGFEPWAPAKSSNITSDTMREISGFIKQNIPTLVRGGVSALSGGGTFGEIASTLMGSMVRGTNKSYIGHAIMNEVD